jgi:hypothetical protein
VEERTEVDELPGAHQPVEPAAVADRPGPEGGEERAQALAAGRGEVSADGGHHVDLGGDELAEPRLGRRHGGGGEGEHVRRGGDERERRAPVQADRMETAHDRVGVEGAVYRRLGRAGGAVGGPTRGRGVHESSRPRRIWRRFMDFNTN